MKYSVKLRKLITKPLYRAYEDRVLRRLDRSRLPQHVGVIHDGHRRFARESGLPDLRSGYRAGMDKFLEFLDWCDEVGVSTVTCWLLSQENLSRPSAELEPYYELLESLFERIPNVADGHDLHVRFIGSLNLLPDHLVAAARRLEERRPAGTRRLTIALAYAGRQEIVDACRDLVGKLAASGMEPDEIASHIDAETLAANLYTSDLPDPDLVIRTSGEARLSGFLLWQAAYAEYSFVDVYWPAFRRVDFLRALRDFTRRERRFGK